MITLEQVSSLYGMNVYDSYGDKIGTVGAVWEDGTGQPAWAGIRTGLFGTNESLVPLQEADLRCGELAVPFEKAKVKDAPNVDASHEEPLSEQDVRRLYAYYNLNWEHTQRTYQSGAAAGDPNRAGGYDRNTQRNTTGKTTTRTATDAAASRGGADEAMTRSEEHLTAGTRRETVGRARLRKYVVTEQQQITIPVEREEVRLVREPITDANVGAAYSGPEIAEAEHEIILHAERPVVTTETVPVERVRLGKDVVKEQQTVTGTVRKERIEADLPGEPGRRTLG